MFKHKKIAKQTIQKINYKTIKIKNCKPISSPIKTQFNLHNILQNQQNKEYIDMQPNQSLVNQQFQVNYFSQQYKYQSQKLQNKENIQSSEVFQTAKANTFQNQQFESIIQQLVKGISEIKNQNQYLIERNADMEYNLEKNIKQKIEEEIQPLRKEIKLLRLQNQKQMGQLNKIRHFKRSLMGQKQRKFILNPQNQQQQQVQQQKPQITTQNTDKDNTFIRKLEESKDSMDYQLIQQEPNQMGLSAGQKLLQMMQFNQNKMNFNGNLRKRFRCNINEIDKILEEDQTKLRRSSKIGRKSREGSVSSSRKSKKLNSSLNKQQSQQQFQRKKWCNQKKIERKPKMGFQKVNENMIEQLLLGVEEEDKKVEWKMEEEEEEENPFENMKSLVSGQKSKGNLFFEGQEQARGDTAKFGQIFQK